MIFIFFLKNFLSFLKFFFVFSEKLLLKLNSFTKRKFRAFFLAVGLSQQWSRLASAFRLSSQVRLRLRVITLRPCIASYSVSVRLRASARPNAPRGPNFNTHQSLLATYPRGAQGCCLRQLQKKKKKKKGPRTKGNDCGYGFEAYK